MTASATRGLSCMGGFGCPMRDSCRHHHAENRGRPRERLCAKGELDNYAVRDGMADPRIQPKKVSAAAAYKGTLPWLRDRCVVDAATGCWHWRMARRSDGAPSVHVMIDGRKSNMRGRRAAIYIATGELPPKHLRAFAIDECTSADCVNPAHARLGTLRQFGQWLRRTQHLIGLPTKREGSRAGWARRRGLSVDEVLEIRTSDESHAALAERMGMSKASIWSASVGRTYRDVGMRVGSVFDWRP